MAQAAMPLTTTLHTAVAYSLAPHQCMVLRLDTAQVLAALLVRRAVDAVDTGAKIRRRTASQQVRETDLLA
eukprot:COSAG05_NODE_5332_length_1205_cov_1.547920_1_plen_71_part_00